MFTGIVQGTPEVAEIRDTNAFRGGCLSVAKQS